MFCLCAVRPTAGNRGYGTTILSWAYAPRNKRSSSFAAQKTAIVSSGSGQEQRCAILLGCWGPSCLAHGRTSPWCSDWGGAVGLGTRRGSVAHIRPLPRFATGRTHLANFCVAILGCFGFVSPMAVRPQVGWQIEGTFVSSYELGRWLSLFMTKRHNAESALWIAGIHRPLCTVALIYVLL